MPADTLPYPAASESPEHPARKRRRRKLPPLMAGAHGVAQMLDCGLRTVRAMDAAGKLPKPIRLGGKVLWSIDELRNWIRAACPCRSDWERIRTAR